MKRRKTGRSARHGRSISPYTKYDKRPVSYKDDRRLASGELQTKANDRLQNKYA